MTLHTTIDYDDYNLEKKWNLAQMVADVQAESDKKINRRIKQRIHDARLEVMTDKNLGR